VLVFSKTSGFAKLIPTDRAIRKLGQENGFAVDATEDAGAFTQKDLARYRAVVFLVRRVTSLMQRNRRLRAVHPGGRRIRRRALRYRHEYDWPWYGRLAGAYFNGIQQSQRSQGG